MTAALKHHAPHHPRQRIAFPRPIPKAARAKIEAAVEAHLEAIEALTACLDAAEPDPDLEPSLGICPNGPSDDRELDVVDEPHDEAEEGNSEPSLAHTNDLDQERAAKNATGTRFVRNSEVFFQQDQDLEAEHDGREPSLGAPERNFAGAYRSSFSQEGWAAGVGDDRENDGDDLEPDVDDEPNRCPATMDVTERPRDGWERGRVEMNYMGAASPIFPKPR